MPSSRPPAVIKPTPTPAMVEYDEAQTILSALADTLHSPKIDTIPLSLANGRILAENLSATTSRPESDISAMDGYTFCCADIPTTDAHSISLPPQDYIVAGDQPSTHHRGTAATILTGARIPFGADCVIARERVTMRNGMIHLNTADAIVGKNIRRAGEEFPVGHLLLNAGQKLDWRHIGLLASQNVRQLAVYRPYRIGVLANGAEFAPDAPDCRADINTPMLCAMLESMGLHVEHRIVGSDSQAELRNTVKELTAQSDIVITTGGISVGQTDNVLPVMEQLGARCLFRRVKIRPGKPFTLMQLAETPVFCLPGNPGAAAICTQIFVLPFLRSISGIKPRRTPSTTLCGRSSFAFSSPPNATCLIPVQYAPSGKEGVFSLVPSQGASDVLCFSHASGILRIPAGHVVNVGDWCSAMPFSAVYTS
ncbi:molybdopterin molybdotransferase MoeA [Acetobacter okinawensis]|uniref:molybdopterin molybdotransferase MoeA n=1 Tax=Acetobacter okinawensis TaxID=1076594 RepID=UPI0031454537